MKKGLSIILLTVAAVALPIEDRIKRIDMTQDESNILLEEKDITWGYNHELLMFIARSLNIQTDMVSTELLLLQNIVNGEEILEGDL